MIEPIAVARDALGELREAIEIVASACEDLDIDFFVVGAAARDILLNAVHGIPLIRATGDVDIGVGVQSWDEYELLIRHFRDDLGFQRTPIGHRVTRGPLVVDVIPFGHIADEDARIQWPEGDRVMSVLGFAEVFKGAVIVEIEDGPTVRVASLAGLAILKLVAWSERPHARPQDPMDLCTIMKNYEQVIGMNLYEDHDDLIDDDFDTRLAHARILGRDMAPLLRAENLRQVVLSVLEDNLADPYESPLIDAMGRDCYLDRDVRFRCLSALRDGIVEQMD